MFCDGLSYLFFSKNNINATSVALHSTGCTRLLYNPVNAQPTVYVD